MFYLGIILPRLPLLTDMTSFYSIRRPLIGVLLFWPSADTIKDLEPGIRPLPAFQLMP